MSSAVETSLAHALEAGIIRDPSTSLGMTKKGRLLLEQCNLTTFAVLDLIERALLGRFLLSPPNDFCAVTKTVASEMIVRYFDYDFRIDRLPFAAAVRAG